MQCVWESFIHLLPLWMREQVDKQGKDRLQELRMRLGTPLQMVLDDRIIKGNRLIDSDDINHTINMASKYSPWATATTADGYITVHGGHRIGLCGITVNADGKTSNIHKLTSICIRIARNLTGIAKDAWKTEGSILIIGAPGSGKTTLLRDLICSHSNHKDAAISVVDERQEIFPCNNGIFCFDIGSNTDVISGCSKSEGIEAALRNTGPTIIAVDEITAQSDCDSLMNAAYCGVDLIATAHAASSKDLHLRSVYRPLVDSRLFDHLLVMVKEFDLKLYQYSS